MTNQQGAPEALRQILLDPENQPNQYGVQFLMHGPKMAFKIGVRQFTLDYEPTEPGEFEFMRDALIDAFSVFTPDVKMAQQPAPSAAVPVNDEQKALKALHYLFHGMAEEALTPQPSPSSADEGGGR